MQPRSLMLSTERVVLRGADVALDVAVDVKAARELDVAMYPGFRPDQGADGRLTTRFLT